MTRAAIYCRVSTDRQEDEGSSLPSQLASCRTYAQQRGYIIGHEAQDTATGSKYRERPGLTALRELVRQRAVDVVIVHAIDRYSRNQAHLAILIEELSDHGGRLECVTEAFEDTAVGRFILAAKGFAAEIERERLIERVTRGRKARVEAGRLLPNDAPLYGYQWADASRDRLVADPGTAAVVSRIYTACLAGQTLRQLAIALMADGVPSPSGAVRWWPGSIRRILKNPAYAGRAFGWTWAKRDSRSSSNADYANAIPLPAGTVAPIVDEASWQQVQVILARNQQQATRNNRHPEASLLRGGYAVCGYCLRKLTVEWRTDVGTPRYKCTNHRAPGGDCPHFSIDAAALDTAVWESVVEGLTRPDIIAVQRERAEAHDQTAGELAAVDHRIADVERRRANIVAAIALIEDPVDRAELVTQLGNLGTRRRDLADERTAITQRAAQLRDAERFVAGLAGWQATVRDNLAEATYATKREWLDVLEVRAAVRQRGDGPRIAVRMKLDRILKLIAGDCDSGSLQPESQVELRWVIGEAAGG